MQRHGVKRFYEAVASVAFAVFASVGPPAAAQQATKIDAPAPEAIAVTTGGVDIRTGRYALDELDMSIGSGAGAIELRRIMAATIKGHVNPFGNLSHNWDITLVVRPKLLVPELELGNYDQLANVSYGGRSQTFERLDSSEGHDVAFRQKSQNDFTRLTTPGTAGAPGAVYTYQATDGTLATFRPMSTNECSNTWTCAFVSNIVEPDGTRYDFEYETTTSQIQNRTRLRSVVSSRGYALLFEYSAAEWNQISRTCVINLGVTAKPVNNVCPSAASSSATYNYAGKRLTSVTRPDNSIQTYAYNTVGAGPAFNMEFRKPGQSAPWQTISYDYANTPDGDLEPIVLAQSFADSSGFTYSYDLSPVTTSSQPSYQTVVGGSFANALGQSVQVRYAFPPAITNGTGQTPENVGEGGVGTANNYDTFSFQITPGPVRIVDPLGRETQVDYCDANAMANLPATQQNRCLVTLKQFTTDAEGAVVKLRYGINNNLIEIRRVAKPASGLPDIVETATYSTSACLSYLKTCDKPLTVTDAKGATTEYTWDSSSGNMLTETRAAPFAGAVRPQKRYSYIQAYAWYKNAAGALVQSPYPVWLLSQISQCRNGAAPACVGTADETRTSYAYGPAGTVSNLLPVTITVAAGDGSVTSVSTFTYDNLGNKLTEDGPQAGTADTTRWRYDTARRVTGVIKPDPDGSGALKFRATRNTYNPAGSLVKVEAGTVISQSDADWASFVPLQTVETTYDQLDRKIREWSYGSTGETQRLTQYSYDLAGRLECAAVRMNPAVYTSLPASACNLSATGSDGPDRITRLTYDAAGQLVRTTVAYGTSEQTDQETNTYTLNGQLATVTDGENNRTTFEYDGHGRLSKTRYPVNAPGALTSSTTDYEQLTYDANGNVIQHRKRDGQLINFSYDALNRQTNKDVPNLVAGEYDITTSYDNLDRPINVSDTTGNNVGSGYDALGRMVMQSSPLGTFALSYDAANRLTRITHPDGNYFTYTYNATDLTSIKENGTVTLVGYGYDDLGRRTAITRGNGATTSYAYDPVGRLGSYTQDLAGTANDLTINGPAPGAQIAYIPSGQIKSQTRSNDSYAWTAHYNVNRSYGVNGLNQLTTAGATALGYDLRGNLTSSGSNIYAYTSENRLATAPGGAMLYYDPTGRLSRITQGANTTRFEHIGPRLVIERNAAGTILRRYVHGPGDDEPVVWYEGSALTTKRWLHTDERGSVISLSDASGTSIATNRYDEYGIPQSTNSGRFQYTGQVWIAELGLYYYKARFYSPTLGRFMQTDPIGYNDGINWYAYVGNDPVNKIDPHGQESANYDSNGNWKSPDIEGNPFEDLADFLFGGIIEAATQPSLKTIAIAAIDASPGAKAFKAGKGLLRSIGKKALDAGKSSRHGDGGRALAKSKNVIEKLTAQREGASKAEKKKIDQKIKNIKEDAKRKKRGEEHHNR